MLMSACGGDSSASDDPRVPVVGTPLTMEQAQTLAEVLHDNYDGEGATFSVSARLADGSALRLDGEVDFVDHVGQAQVQANGVEAPVTEVVWTESAVLERRPTLDAQLAAAGFAAARFVARPPDPTGRDLDAMLGVITGLASTRDDNALLVGQQEGSAWLRTDVVRDVPVDVMRYGERSIYWLDSVTGALLRFEGNSAAGDRPFVVDLLAAGPRDIAGPAAVAVVDIDDVREIYEAPAG